MVLTLDEARNLFKRNGGFISLIFVDAVIALANVAKRTSSFIFKKSSFGVLVGHTVVALAGVVSWTCAVLGNCYQGPSSGGAKLSLRHVIRRAATFSWDRLRFR